MCLFQGLTQSDVDSNPMLTNESFTDNQQVTKSKCEEVHMFEERGWASIREQTQIQTCVKPDLRRSE